MFHHDTVTEFAKKTGDYASLSATDIKVLALTYQLEVEVNSTEHIKLEPQMNKSVVVGPKPPSATGKTENVAGFFMPKVDQVDELTEKVDGLDVKESADEEYVDLSSEDEKEDVENCEESDDDGDDDDGGWITPGNIREAKNQMAGVLETVQLDVACLTTDFAMQARSFD